MQKMTRLTALAMIFAMAIVLAPSAQATVNLLAGPTSLIPDPIFVKAASAPVPLFAFTLSQDAGENLISVSVLVNQNATTTVSGSGLANVSVYKDNGDGIFSAADTLEGSQTSVNIGTNTAVSMATTTPATGEFFVTLSTGGSWSGAAPADSVKVTLPDGQIALSAGSVSYGDVTTNSLTADTAGPVLLSAVAKDTGGTAAKEAGDSVDLTFSEATNKPAITNANLPSFLSLNNGHSFLDLGGNLGGASWDVAGAVLTLTLSGTTTPSSTMPTVAVGDTVSVSGSGIQDLAGNPATGSQIITGSFGSQTNGGQDDRDDEGEEHEGRGICGNGLTNGQLYQISGSATVYLAAACRLKPFRGAAVFHARGEKFQNITVLPALPADVTVSQHPVLPGAGSLIKGSDKTVWFVDKDGKREGFTSADVFHSLGFDFKQVKQISDQDLGVIPADAPISSAVSHPQGALIKCGASPTVFEVIGDAKFPFTSASAFLSRGHSWDNIVAVDCGRFSYVVGAAVKD